MTPRTSLDSFAAALERLGDALAQPRSEWTRDAAIQRFEFTFELAWKCIQRVAAGEGLMVASPRDAFKTALRLGWIDDEPVWLAMIEDRNRTTHTYRQEMAEQIYERLGGYHRGLKRLCGSLESA